MHRCNRWYAFNLSSWVPANANKQILYFSAYNYMLQLSFHMSATTILCYNPSSKFLGTNPLKQRYLKKNSFSPSLSGSRSFTCGFVLFNLRGKSAMDGFERTAYRDGNSDEHVQVLEQEAFVGSSSELQPKFLFQEMESTLNQLVGNPCPSQIATPC